MSGGMIVVGGAVIKSWSNCQATSCIFHHPEGDV